MQHRAQPLGPCRRRPAARSGSGASRSVAFARLMRWAIVASGTRNAAAISRVVSPPTARRVSGIAVAGAQRRVAAHEHHDQRVVGARAPASGGSIGGRRGEVLPTAPGRRPGGAGRPCRRDATRIEPAERVVAARRRPATRSRRRAAPPGPRPRRRRSRRTGGRPRRGPAARARAAGPRPGRRSRLAHAVGGGARPSPRAPRCGAWTGTPFGPGAAESRAAISTARSSVSTSIDAVAGDQLLGLGVRTVGDDRRRRRRPTRTNFATSGPARPWASTSSPSRGELLVQRDLERRCGPACPPASTRASAGSPDSVSP